MAATPVRLTELSHGAGCACKLPAGSLRQVLAGLPRVESAELMVGHEGLDDAAVWRISDELAVVQTIDFFTPLVDDPYQFGRIAATNAFSDIYAMGARPAFALNVVAFPKTLPMELLGEILRGGADVAAAAGAVVAGGHSIDDPEPKYGMAVTGFAHPDEIWTNAGGRAGDVLVLSKRDRHRHRHHRPQARRARPGGGRRGGRVDDDAERRRRRGWCGPRARTRSPTSPASAWSATPASWPPAPACRPQIDWRAVRLLPGVRELIEAGHVPGGTRTNLDLAAEYAEFGAGLSETDRLLACDAQTSGGLFVSLPAERAAALPWPVIGRLVEGAPGTVAVR